MFKLSVLQEIVREEDELRTFLLFLKALQSSAPFTTARMSKKVDEIDTPTTAPTPFIPSMLRITAVDTMTAIVTMNYEVNSLNRSLVYIISIKVPMITTLECPKEKYNPTVIGSWPIETN